MTTTCASTSFSDSSRASRRPLPSGRFLSTTRRSVCACVSFARASPSETAAATTKPMPSSTSTTTARTTSSSSMTRARNPDPTCSVISTSSRRAYRVVTTFVPRDDHQGTVVPMRIGTRALLILVPVAVLSPQRAQIGEPVYLASRADDPSLADRPVLDPSDIAAFARSIPLRAALQVGTAVGPAHASRAGDPRVSVAVRARGGPVLAVEFSLSRLLPLVSESRLGARGEAAVVDRSGAGVLSSSREQVAARTSLSASPLVQAAVAGRLGAMAFRADVARLGATAEVPDLGWIVAVDEPAEDALVESRVLARRTALAVAIALAAGVVLALVAGDALVRPIRALHRGAAALARGDLTHRVGGERRGDELGELARAS